MADDKNEKKVKDPDRTRANVAAGVIVGIAVILVVAATILLSKISDAKLKKYKHSDSAAGDGKSAVTELDTSSGDSSGAPVMKVPYKQPGTADTKTDSQEDEDGLPQTVLPDSEAEPKKFAAHASDLSDLKTTLNDTIAYYPGEWSVYVQELKTGESILINEKPMYAASLIKLFAMGAAYEQIKDGHLNEEYAYGLIYQMITESDNNSFDNIVDLMQEDHLPDWLMQNGFWDTTYVHGLGDGVIYEGKRSPDGDNFTSAKDVGKLLEKLYRGELVSAHYSEEMVNIMKDQQSVSKIPAGLPEGVVSANKTGETDNVCHDSAIVYSDGGDYVLVVMANAPGEAWVCDPFVTDISRTVYNYFNTLAEDSSGISAEEYYDDEYDFETEENYGY